MLKHYPQTSEPNHESVAKAAAEFRAKYFLDNIAKIAGQIRAKAHTEAWDQFAKQHGGGTIPKPPGSTSSGGDADAGFREFLRRT